MRFLLFSDLKLPFVNRMSFFSSLICIKGKEKCPATTTTTTITTTTTTKSFPFRYNSCVRGIVGHHLFFRQGTKLNI